MTMALGALEEVAAICRYRPIRRSGALRLVLAYLAARQPCDRHAFDNFWRGVDHPRRQDRGAALTGALNGIYLAVGVRRDTAVMSEYEKRARARFMGEDRPENASGGSRVVAQAKSGSAGAGEPPT
jgi:hypothetical protein